jgi:hypothetical protein
MQDMQLHQCNLNGAMTLRIMTLSILTFSNKRRTLLYWGVAYADCPLCSGSHISPYVECRYVVCRYVVCRYVVCRYVVCRYAVCCYVVCRYVVCRYAVCRYVECRGAA